MCSPCGSDCCWLTCILMGLVWLLVSSALLMFVWNTVVAGIATVKKIPFGHALLVVLLLAILFGPIFRGGPCGGSMNCGPNPCMSSGQPGCGGNMQCSEYCKTPCGKMAKPDSTK